MHMRRWRTLARTGCVLAAAALPLVAAPLAAQASATVSTCNGTADWFYSAGLGTGTSFGTITANYSYSCDDAYYQNSFGTRVGQDVYSPSWTNSYPYSGSCALASFRYGYNYSSGTYEGSGLLVGGAVAVATSGNSNYAVAETGEVDVMAPLLAPCLESSSLGASSATFVGEY
jgi:hypothetical protein